MIVDLLKNKKSETSQIEMTLLMNNDLKSSWPFIWNYGGQVTMEHFK